VARIKTIAREELGEFAETFERLEAASGYSPNSLLTMAHRPKLLAAFLPLAIEVLAGETSLPRGLRNLVANVASLSAGCLYCIAHTAEASAQAGVETEKIAAAFEYETSPLFSEAERAALNLAQSAASVPNMVNDGDFEALRRHFAEEQIVEIMGVISLFGFLNRWNDSIGTDLEDHPRGFAEETIAATGWIPGKHGAG
jgi:uncharacterized peroxidase-related enzyme